MIRKRASPSVDDIVADTRRHADRYRKEMRRWQDRARHWEREFHALAEAVNIRTTIVQEMTRPGGTTAGYEFWTYALGVAELVAAADASEGTVNGTG